MLPAIDMVEIVEIVDIAEVDVIRVSEYMDAAIDAPRVCVAGAQAQAIASLWRSLPAGEQMRCHVPRYGLRFFDGTELLAEASICWECNNIFGRTAAGPFAMQFGALIGELLQEAAVWRVESGTV